MTTGAFVSLLGIAAAIKFSVEGYTDGLIPIIALLLAVLRFVVAMKG